MAHYVKEEKKKNSQTESSSLSHLFLKDWLPDREAVSFTVSSSVLGRARFESFLSIISPLFVGKFNVICAKD